MKNKILVFLILTACNIKIIAAQQITFENSYGRNTDERGYSVEQISNGGYIMTGVSNYAVAGGEDVFLVKTDSIGDTLWTRTYGGTNSDYGASVYPANDGGYIISGYTKSFGAGNYDVYLLKTNANGVITWTKTYGGSADDYGYSVQQTSDGGYIVAGKTSSFGASISHVYLIKTDANGDTLWTRILGGPSLFIGYSVQQTSDGGYIIAGWNGDVYLLKTDANGNPAWARSYGGSGDDRGLSVKQTSDGGYIVGGYTSSFGAGSYDVYLIRTNVSGDTLWTKTYGGSGYDVGNSVIQTSDGGFAIAGYADSFGSPGIYTIRTNQNGVTQWAKIFGSSGGAKGNSLRQTNDGGYIILGDGGSYDFYLVKTDSNGSGCNQVNVTTLAGHPGTQVTVLVTPVSSGGAITNPITTIGSGGTFTMFCSDPCNLPSAIITPAGATTFCPGGYVILNVNYGAGLSPQWKLNGIDISGQTGYSYLAMTPGSYTVVITNSCGSVSSSAASVTVSSLPSAAITPAGPTTFCSGGSVVLNAPAGANKTYQWKKGANLISGATLASYTATTGGNYKVIVTNTVTGCSKTTAGATVVTVNALPAATITPQGPTTFCAGGSVVLAANTATGLTYKWKKGSNFISGATLSNYTATTGGNYKVQVTNSNGCSKTSGTVAVSVPCKEGESEKVRKWESEMNVSVFPNPNSGEFTIKFSTKPTSPIQIELTDEIGKVVKRFETNDETVVIKESNLSKGIYCLTLRNSDKVVVKKINIVK